MLMYLAYTYIALASICTAGVFACAAISSQMSRLEENLPALSKFHRQSKPYSPGLRTQILYGLRSLTRQNPTDF